MRVLLTGGSGVVGRELIPILDRCGADVVTIGRSAASSHHFAADLTRPDLALAAEHRLELAHSVDAIVHCAANTSFDSSALTANRDNVDATENLLQLARTFRRLDRIVILSTTYVSGKRTGIMRGSELHHDAGFVNEYERSKFELETRLAAHHRDLPIAVVRLSTILARSTGEVPRYDAVHRALSLFHQGLIPMLPGDRETKIDLIAVDEAAAAVAAVTMRLFEAKTTKQFARGHSSPSLSTFLELSARAFAELDPGWKRKGIELPDVVRWDTYEHLTDGIRRTGDAFLGSILDSMRSFIPQLSYPKIFASDFPETEPFEPWYRRVLTHAIHDRFGRAAFPESA